ncbi:hypothetical protein SAMN05421507_109237 [Lentzea jiangxiensis]|uniref:Uncharacterized protein n=1 Tax=Lentzea jiangxiensis TaxID=641025 RepID=A0A1H0TD41_9PSEU|nr:hypothetical protein SAMN05421507_109237 [Lentzea jiangxiensis]
MWTINQVEQSSPFGGVLEMSHREKPRNGRGCFGAVVVVPFLALGGLFALIAFVGGPAETPLVAPPPVQATTSQWWTEPFETGVALSTVTETVVVEGAARAARSTTAGSTTAGSTTAAPASTRVSGATVTETVRASSSAGKPSAAGRNEPAPSVEESEPVVPSGSSPAVTTAPTAVSTAKSSPSVKASSSPPRAEEPVPVVAPCAEPLSEGARGSADLTGSGVGAARGRMARYCGTLARA